MFASEDGDEVAVQMLLARDDIEPDPESLYGPTPLTVAAENDQVNGRIPLMVAAWNGHEKVVQVLLGKNDVNPNIPDKSGEAPLWCAA